LTEPRETLKPAGSLMGDAMGGMWSGSPSVWHRSGGDWLVMNVPFNQGLRVVRNDGTVLSYPNGGKNSANVPIADIDHDGIPDIILASVLQNAEGLSITTWPASRRIRNGFAPAIGDANGDGEVEVYMVSWNVGVRDASFSGYDR